MRNRLPILLLLLLLLTSFTTYGQTAETIRTSRPGQAIEPFTVGQGVGQVQTGFTQTWLTFGSSSFASNGYDAVLRYGILEQFELSALFNYARVGVSSNNPVSGLSDFHVGMKYNIYEGDGLIPAVGVQYRLKLPAVSDNFRPDGTASQVKISAQSSLTEKLSLTVNTGWDWNGFNPEATWFYILNLSAPIAERWGVFIENYGDRANGSTNTYFDGGTSFLVNPNFQLDLSVGAADIGLLNQYFVSTGLSWRFGAGN